MTVPISWYLLLAAVLFAIGTLGALSRRNGITIFLSIELMLNSVNLAIVAYARVLGERTGELASALNGQILVLFVLAVAAAEAAVGLALFIAVYRDKRTIDINRLNLMRW
jgi:NADH-quinone oxidoreductase subunit K